MTAAELARRLDVPTNRVTEILNGQRAITGDTALRLAHFFGTSAEFWLNLQSLYELRLAEAKTGKAIKRLPTLSTLRTRMLIDGRQACRARSNSALPQVSPLACSRGCECPPADHRTRSRAHQRATAGARARVEPQGGSTWS
jgi:addiction module HigA family antidote